jgi:hypothetical protein
MHTILRLSDVKRSTGLSRRLVGSRSQEYLQERIEASRSEIRGTGATLGAPLSF